MRRHIYLFTSLKMAEDGNSPVNGLVDAVVNPSARNNPHPHLLHWVDFLLNCAFCFCFV